MTVAMSETVAVAIIVQAAGLIAAAIVGWFKLKETRLELTAARAAAQTAAANTSANGGSSPYDHVVRKLDVVVERIDQLTADGLDARRERAQGRGAIEALGSRLDVQDRQIAHLAAALAQLADHLEHLERLVLERHPLPPPPPEVRP